MENPATSSVNLGTQLLTVGIVSVSTTATITGAAKQTNTLNYEGNTTWNTNQTNTLTTGNTGTVAVLSDAVFPVYLQHGGTSPVDGTTYYFGNLFNVLSTVPIMGNITLPYNCTLVSWNYNTATGGLSTAESVTLSIAGSTNYTLSTAVTYSAYPINFAGSGLSQSFNAGDVINAKLICPTWVTNPTNVVGGLTLWFVRRQ